MKIVLLRSVTMLSGVVEGEGYRRAGQEDCLSDAR